jgi:ABC-type uncharacterized transport system substrate-binding protein
MLSLTFAHPHVFVNVYPTINNKTVKIKWVYDDMTSTMLLLDYDANSDNDIDTHEQEFIYDDIFASLVNYDYYTYFYNKNTKLSVAKLIDFKASVENRSLVFTFELQIPDNATSVHFYDNENWTGYILEQEFIDKANPNKKYTLINYQEELYFAYKLDL